MLTLSFAFVAAVASRLLPPRFTASCHLEVEHWPYIYIYSFIFPSLLNAGRENNNRHSMRVHSRIFIYIHTMTRTYLHMSRSICFFFTSCFHFSINNIRYSYRLTSSTILFHRNILTPRMFSFCCVSSQCVFKFFSITFG